MKPRILITLVSSLLTVILFAFFYDNWRDADSRPDPVQGPVGPKNQQSRLEPKERESSYRHGLSREVGIITQAELFSILANEGMMAAWEVASAIEEENYRRGMQEALLKKIGKMGLISEGLILVQSNVGIGKLREDLIYNLISRSNLSVTHLLEIHDQLEEIVDRKGILRGIGYRVMLSGFAFDAHRRLETLSTLESEAIAGGLGVFLNQGRGTTGQVLETMSKLVEGQSNPGKVAFQFARKLPLQTAKKVAEHLATNGGITSESLSSVIIGKIAMLAPEWLIDHANSNPNSVDPKMIMKAGDLIAFRNPKRAKEILERHDDPASTGYSALLAGLGNAAGNQGDFNRAREWLGQIRDPEIQSHGERSLWMIERKAVLQEVKSDPEVFFDQFRLENPPHDEYWIREGFKTWFESRPIQANEWFAREKDDLTRSQTQHVARAYAEVALGEGDINLARQWAEQVVDPNFKQKLVEQIDAAAGETE